MSNPQKIAEIREAMPVTQNKIYLNTGTCGPLSTITVEVMQQSNTLELIEGRAGMPGMAALLQAKTEARQAVAKLVNARPEEIALTHHTTEGMNIVAHGLSWQPGDEIITTTLEHEGGLLPLYVLRDRHGVKVHVVDIQPGDIVAQFERHITPRTRLLVFSHVAWNTGLRLPLEDIVAMGHDHHVLSLVDGAQSVGAIPLDRAASGVDVYAMPGQKGLCGPEGTGALYVRQERLHLVAPTFVGFSSLEDVSMYDFHGYFMPARTARRYEVGTVYRPGIKAMVANLAWLSESVGWDWIYARIIHLAGYARDRLGKLPGLTVITPPGPQAGLVTFTLDGHDPARVMAQLAEKEIILRYLRHPYALRIATGFYNTEEEIDRLADALVAIQQRRSDSSRESGPPGADRT